MNHFALHVPMQPELPAFLCAFNQEEDRDFFVAADRPCRSIADRPDDTTGFRHSLWTYWPRQVSGWIKTVPRPEEAAVS